MGSVMGSHKENQALRARRTSMFLAHGRLAKERILRGPVGINNLPNRKEKQYNTCISTELNSFT